MAFRKKWHSVVDQKPDILVIQECESPEKFKDSQQIPDYNSFLWYGLNVNKGIAIITFNDYKAELRYDYDDSFQYIIPITISKSDKSFDLYAIWAMPHKIKRNSYVGQIWNALQHYPVVRNTNSIYVGDFNSNQIWDKLRPKGNHTLVKIHLNNQGLVSTYHYLKQERHGQELTPTIYLLKQLNKPYHLDYCFVPEQWIKPKTTVEIGTPQEWLKLSDHMPVIINGLEWT